MRKFAGVPDAVSRAITSAVSGALSSFGALRFDQVQTLTQAQAAQARINLGLTAPLKISAATALSPTLGLWREYEFAGAYTATAPAASSVFAGWRTGNFHNRGNGSIATANFVGTIAVPSGAYLDGVLNGTKTLAYGQKGYLYFDATAMPNPTWRWVWVDRSPILMIVNAAAGTASFDFAIPAGYAALEFAFFNLVMSNNGQDWGYRLSADSGNTIRSGAADYSVQLNTGQNSNSGASSANQSYGTLAANISNNSAYATAGAALTRGVFETNYGSVVATAYRENTTPSQASDIVGSRQSSGGSSIINPNLIRFIAQAGTFSVNGYIRGVPAQ